MSGLLYEVKPPLIIIERVYTADRIVPLYENGIERGWTCEPVPPDESGQWFVYDASPDDKTGWRKISIGWQA